MTFSPHFTLAEFLRSDTADAQRISNIPTWEDVAHLARLADLMERIRAAGGGQPVTILSGYRCPQLNAAVGGATNSAHLFGLACDFVIPGYGSPQKICQALEPHVAVLGIDQLIWEFGDWVHLGLVAHPSEPRCQCLTIDNAGTRYGFG